MERPSREGFEAVGTVLSSVKHFYDSIFEWEAIYLDPGDPSQNSIQYSAGAKRIPLTQIDLSDRPNTEINLGVFTVDDIDSVCQKVELNGGQLHAVTKNVREAWCFCSDPAGNRFSIVEVYDRYL